jgi:hypothetical protein
VPLAVVLWNGGISFGGVISFIFGDLIILPILNIYRKYYGARMSLYLLGASYVAMALAGFVIGAVFQLAGWVPTNHHVAVLETTPSWNYTTMLDIAFIVLMAVLAWRFFKTGGPDMVRAMSHPPQDLSATAVDPVCGMSVDVSTAKHTMDYESHTYYFCSPGCRQTFDADPAKYAADATVGHPHS